MFILVVFSSVLISNSMFIIAEIKLLKFKPSIIAASALLVASKELLPLQFPSFKFSISAFECVNEVRKPKISFFSLFTFPRKIFCSAILAVINDFSCFRRICLIALIRCKKWWRTKMARGNVRYEVMHKKWW